MWHVASLEANLVGPAHQVDVVRMGRGREQLKTLHVFFIARATFRKGISWPHALCACPPKTSTPRATHRPAGAFSTARLTPDIRPLCPGSQGMRYKLSFSVSQAVGAAAQEPTVQRTAWRSRAGRKVLVFLYGEMNGGVQTLGTPGAVTWGYTGRCKASLLDIQYEPPLCEFRYKSSPMWSFLPRGPGSASLTFAIA